MKDFLRKRLTLQALFVFLVFLIMLISIFIIGVLGLVLVRVIRVPAFTGPNPLPGFLALLLFSLVVGTVLATVVSKRLLGPLREVIEATKRVADGDFSVRILTEGVPEMQDLTDSFNTMVKELGGIETLRNDFISNFSHEFKTPIVSIRGFAKLLRDKDLPEEDRDEYVEIIIQESGRLSHLATNVLNLSRLENTEIITDRDDFRLDEQIRRVAALVEHKWSEKGIAVQLDLENVTLCSNAELLEQVWVNLLDNAIKFTGEGGHIDLTLRRWGKEVKFTIADTGIGMDEQTRAHLFDKFYQGETSHAGAGNGLGLAMVRRIVMLCGGGIEVESEAGKGSAFTITLPF